MVDHENLVTISCFCTFLIFIQSYIFNFCIYFKCFFLYLYIYSVTKILRKIRATTFTENYGKLRVRGMSAWMSERCFQLVLIMRSFTRSLPARIQRLTRHKPLKLFFFGLHEANLYNLFLRWLLDI